MWAALQGILSCAIVWKLCLSLEINEFHFSGSMFWSDSNFPVSFLFFHPVELFHCVTNHWTNLQQYISLSGLLSAVSKFEARTMGGMHNVSIKMEKKKCFLKDSSDKPHRSNTNHKVLNCRFRALAQIIQIMSIRTHSRDAILY